MFKWIAIVILGVILLYHNHEDEKKPQVWKNNILIKYKQKAPKMLWILFGKMIFHLLSLLGRLICLAIRLP